MSRAGYSDDYDDDRLANLYRGRVESALRGRRGQSFLKDLLAQMDAMPEKRLATSQLERNGQVCTLGVMTRARNIDTAKLQFQDEDYDGNEGVIAKLAKELNVANPMIREIMYMNDEGSWRVETPEQRFMRMLAWIASHIEAQ